MIQVGLPEDAAQRRLPDQGRGAHVVQHFHHGFLGVDDPEIDDGVDLHGHVVARDCLLGRHFEGDDAQVDLAHAFDTRNQEEQARSARSDKDTKRHEGYLGNKKIFIMIKNNRKKRHSKRDTVENKNKDKMRG